jgi:uncharacterized protein (TIGR02996 family)
MNNKYKFTNRELALLDAIHAAPRADSAYLAYADWLERRGDPLGEFIRVSWERRHLPHGDARQAALEERWRQLEEKHGEGWIQPLKSLRPLGRSVMPGSLWSYGSYYIGLPIANLVFEERRRWENVDWNLSECASGVWPRHLLRLCIDARPDSEKSIKDRVNWLDVPKVLAHPAMRRVSMVALGFMAGRESKHLRLAERQDIITAISATFDPIRTPWIEIYHASPRVRDHAQRLMGARFVLGLID